MTEKKNFPKGKYFIGDLCYALDDATYEEVVIYNKDVPFAVYSGTAYGDGSYYSKEFNFSFPVDAGIIGIAKYSKCSKLNENPIWAKKAGVIVKANESIIFEAENGIFTITIDSKEFIINTKDEENNNYESGPEDFE
jgi:hypothetical protein